MPSDGRTTTDCNIIACTAPWSGRDCLFNFLMKLLRIVASQSQRYREISLFLFFVHFLRMCSSFVLKMDKVSSVSSECYFRLNLKASDRLHLILHEPRLVG